MGGDRRCVNGFFWAGRWLTAIAIGFCLFRLLWDGAAAGVPFDTVTAAVVQSVDLSQTKTADGQMIRRLYGLDPAEYAGCALYYPAGDMGVTELLLLRVQTDDQLETVQAAAQRRPRRTPSPATRRSSMPSAKTAAPS